MQRSVTTLAIAAGLAAGLGLPVAVSAQTASRSDLAYCNALADIYVRYIGHDENYTSRGALARGDAEGFVAVAKCRQGDAAASIPVLERKLRNEKFTLPPRG